MPWGCSISAFRRGTRNRRRRGQAQSAANAARRSSARANVCREFGDPPQIGRLRELSGRIRDAVRNLHDETVERMNANKDLWTILQEVQLPPALETAPDRGPPHWYVRSIFEEYAGWVRQESTTELYAVPPRDLAGA